MWVHSQLFKLAVHAHTQSRDHHGLCASCLTFRMRPTFQPCNAPLNVLQHRFVAYAETIPSKIPYILESNPHPFLQFKRAKKIRCGLQSRAD